MLVSGAGLGPKVLERLYEAVVWVGGLGLLYVHAGRSAVG